MFSKQKVCISPSLITLDMINVLDNVKELEQSGVELLHIDILDGHFSPSMPLGFELVRQLKPRTKLLFDCHVMTSNPDYFVEELIDIGVEQITFHVETAEHVDGLINKIHHSGIRAGVALKPYTPISNLEYIIDKCDNVLLMLINPGYASSAGESQIDYGEKKISDLKSLIDRHGCETLIEVDGRISLANMEIFPRLGVNLYVAGSTCMKTTDISRSVENMKEALASGCTGTNMSL